MTPFQTVNRFFGLWSRPIRFFTVAREVKIGKVRFLLGKQEKEGKEELLF